ncbi:N-acetyltransferase DgcN [Sphingomonas sp. 37zxx]|uniref:N-acetyltransferase DgcN n=1 Tax=Sphingomonas sp. 37zxx TaxID=1550073 RepID=UPI00053BE63B|nr:N-acetyltransferase DgcN [Sphingomonas sp. 37zxx]
MIPTPYLLYLGHSDDPLGIKTSRGLAHFVPEHCIGEFRHDDCPLTLGIERLTIEEARARGANTLVLGIANPGGSMGQALIEDALVAIALGMHVAAGLHHRLRDVPALVEAARAAGVTLFDVRDAPADLPVGSGIKRAGRRLLTVGTDCSVGKMYTSIALQRAMRAAGLAADFRATGQTGILIAGRGIAVDAVVADFISGAVEVLSPARTDGGWDVIEGQGSLFHPSFAGVSTGLLHGAQPDALVLCDEAMRPHMRGLPHFPVPDLAECLEANLRTARLTNPDVQAVGVCINTSRLSDAEARAFCVEIGSRLALPCTDPVRFGVTPIIEEIANCFGLSPLATTVSP